MRRYRIGRAETNDIVLNETSVSREHAELIKVNRGVFLLKDLRSTYGTSARQGSDWHLVTAENVNYDTPIRIGEFETTVAHLLRELDPIAVYMNAPASAPWATPEPRLSSEERAQHPETTHIGSDPMSAPIPLFKPEVIAAPRSPTSEGKRFVKLSLIGIGAIATAGLITVAMAHMV